MGYMKQGSERIEGNASSATDFMDQYAGDYVPRVRNASDSAEWAAAYQKKYAGEYTDVRNESDSKEWAAAYQKKYAGEYMARYADANTSANGEAVKANAKECQTLAELDAWRE